MKFKPTLIVSGLFAIVFLSSMTGYILGSTENKTPSASAFPPPMQENGELPKLPALTNTTKEPARAADALTECYLLKESGGKIALFIKHSNDSKELYSTYDSPVSLLPEKDRFELKKGIEFSSLSDALEYAEDFLE